MMSSNNNNNNNDSKKLLKQGSYGKVKIHKESLLRQLLHVDEIFYTIWFLYINPPLRSNIHSSYIKEKYDYYFRPEVQFCTTMLQKVSRSFSSVILQLPSKLLMDILVFYLVLRALDTIEDDTTAFQINHNDNNNNNNNNVENDSNNDDDKDEKKMNDVHNKNNKNNKNGTSMKVQHLLDFATKTALVDPKWCLNNVGDGDERVLLQEFPKCHLLYKALPEPSQLIIQDITQQMAIGMAEFVVVSKEEDVVGQQQQQGTIDMKQYNLYCHYVAGLVGIGLSCLASQSQIEDAPLALETKLSNDMGIFLQKTNIIRDYLEDYVDQRSFWPQSIWKKYVVVVQPTTMSSKNNNNNNQTTKTKTKTAGNDASSSWSSSSVAKEKEEESEDKTNNKKNDDKNTNDDDDNQNSTTIDYDLGYFCKPLDNKDDDMIRIERSLQCLNELITDALELVPSCLQYLSKLRCYEYFIFCAIPQIMAIATLDKLYNNPSVYTGVVKIRKGTSCKLIVVGCSSLDQVYNTFHQYATSIRKKAMKLQKQKEVKLQKQQHPSGNHNNNNNPDSSSSNLDQFDRTIKICTEIIHITEPAVVRQLEQRYFSVLFLLFLIFMSSIIIQVYTSPGDTIKDQFEFLLSTSILFLYNIIGTLIVTIILVLFADKPIATTATSTTNTNNKQQQQYHRRHKLLPAYVIEQQQQQQMKQQQGTTENWNSNSTTTTTTSNNKKMD